MANLFGIPYFSFCFLQRKKKKVFLVFSSSPSVRLQLASSRSFVSSFDEKTRRKRKTNNEIDEKKEAEDEDEDEEEEGNKIRKWGEQQLNNKKTTRRHKGEKTQSIGKVGTTAGTT